MFPPRHSVVLVALSVATLALRDARSTSAEPQIAADPVPAWEWETSRTLVTAPTGFCGPPVRVPGRLIESELLAWHVVEDTTRNLRSTLVLWWARYETPSGDSIWALAHGYRHSAPPARESDDKWSLYYICDGGSVPYLRFDRRPTATDARPVSAALWYLPIGFRLVEARIRQTAWRRVLRDDPALALPPGTALLVRP